MTGIISMREEFAYHPKQRIKLELVYKFCPILRLVMLLKNLRTPFKKL
jgi:hypothetical protein